MKWGNTRQKEIGPDLAIFSDLPNTSWAAFRFGLPGSDVVSSRFLNKQEPGERSDGDYCEFGD